MKLRTSRFHSGDLIQHSGMTPVAVSVSTPKWALPYNLQGPVRALAPHPAALRSYRAGELSWEQFADAYRQRLERLGPARICDLLTEHDNGSGVVALCWCSPDLPCHRRELALFLEDANGIEVAELT